MMQSSTSTRLLTSLIIYHLLGKYSCEVDDGVKLILLRLIKTYRSLPLQMIDQAGESGELTPLVLLVIRNRLELARQDVWSHPYYVWLRCSIVYSL